MLADNGINESSRSSILKRKAYSAIAVEKNGLL